ncbi:MAG: putative selenocysteine system protein [Promethearchaeota archaeon]
MENRLLTQFNDVISTQWQFKEVNEPSNPISSRELFELAYHTCNSITTRRIYLKLSPSEATGAQAILYLSSKKFITIDSLDNGVNIKKYYPEGSTGEKLITDLHPNLQRRKQIFAGKEDDLRTQILKTILVERKLDECANYVMLKDHNRKIYFSIGDARESAAVVPIFMEAEGASLVQLALNKWMTKVQLLDQEKGFPENLVPGLLKNLMQIKKWILNLVTSNLEK